MDERPHPEFEARLDQAITMNGLTNATFAGALGPYGQQNINGFRNRGQIGGPSILKVMRLLPKTDFLWLQYGEGRPERFSTSDELSPTGMGIRDLRSLVSRLDPATIRNVHTGLAWRFQLEGQNFDLDRDADLFALAYTFAVSGDGAERGELLKAVDARIAQLTGETSGTTQEPSRSTGSGPN